MPKRIPSTLAALLALGASLAWGQTPFFTDGPAFGGSRVFSGGLNPLGNPARFDQGAPGMYLSYVDGDQRSKDSASILNDLVSTDPRAVSSALPRLADSPWSLRTRGYAVAYLDKTVNSSFSREELNGFSAAPDLDATHAGSAAALLLNGTTFDLRRATVDRLTTGVGSKDGGTAMGLTFRMEQWHYGARTAALNPAAGQLPVTDPGSLLSITDTSNRATAITVDAGFTFELAEGIRVGATGDRLLRRKFQDVDEKPQFRAGLQLDLGTAATLCLEGDLNDAMRMPLPVKQRTTSASLRFQASPTVSLLLGAERRRMDDVSVTRAGATLFLRMGWLNAGFGMQFGQDRPLKGAGLKVY